MNRHHHHHQQQQQQRVDRHTTRGSFTPVEMITPTTEPLPLPLVVHQGVPLTASENLYQTSSTCTDHQHRHRP